MQLLRYHPQLRLVETDGVIASPDFFFQEGRRGGGGEGQLQPAADCNCSLFMNLSQTLRRGRILLPLLPEATRYGSAVGSAVVVYARNCTV